MYLLGYTLDDGVYLIYLEAVGPHENFYRDLKMIKVLVGGAVLPTESISGS